jgi:hypothetical protein
MSSLTDKANTVNAETMMYFMTSLTIKFTMPKSAWARETSLSVQTNEHYRQLTNFTWHTNLFLHKSDFESKYVMPSIANYLSMLLIYYL